VGPLCALNGDDAVADAMSREQLIIRLITDIMRVEKRTTVNLDRAYLLDLIAESVNALNGIRKTERDGR
jgi:hypothetical protein